MISLIFNKILYQPLFNLMVVLYEFLPGKDFGIAVIVLTIFIRFLLYPLSVKAIKSQQTLSKIQPIVKEIQEKYKNDKEKQTTEILDLYKKEKINPFSGIFSLLIQIPVMIALYWVFRTGLDSSQMQNLYSFIPVPGSINPYLLGIINFILHLNLLV